MATTLSEHLNKQKFPSTLSKSDFVTSHSVVKHTPQNASPCHTINLQLITFNENHYSNSLFPLFDIHTPPNFEKMLPTRKASFLAGRIAIKAAFEDIDIPAENIQVGIHKQPLWPDSIKGSISHSKNCSIATLVQDREALNNNIGIDIQHIISGEEINNIRDLVITNEEKKYLSLSVEGWSKDQIFTLLFSAKESFFKAIYPSIKQYLNFTDASIISLDFKTQTITIKFKNDLGGLVNSEKEYQLSFDLLKLDDLHVITYCRI